MRIKRTYLALLLGGLAAPIAMRAADDAPIVPFEHHTATMDCPMAPPWRTLTPEAGYHGVWLVAGDLDGDGQAEIVTARNDRQIVTAVVATKLDGSTLWTWGTAGAGKPGLNYDVPVQIFDLEHDGKPEVFLSVKGHLLVLDGATGREIDWLPLPDGLEVADCITFANLRGKGRRDIIIKDRYRQLWAYSDDWKLLWHWQHPTYKTCHHPELLDVDGDGREEVMAGYTLLDDDGRELWTMKTEKIDLARGHLDCMQVVKAGRQPAEFRLAASCCGANGLVMLDGKGTTLWELAGHHFESVDAGRLRDDVPGPQIVVDIDHQPYGQGPVWLLNDRGERLGSYINGYGRHHRLIDFDGDGLDEILIGNARRLLDGTGRCVLRLGPQDAFAGELGEQPENDPCPLAATGDLDGDGRPEIILHSAKTVRIYRSDKAAKPAESHLGTAVNYTLY